MMQLFYVFGRQWVIMFLISLAFNFIMKLWCEWDQQRWESRMRLEDSDD